MEFSSNSWNPMDSATLNSASLYQNEDRKREYKSKNIKDWDGEDCLEWAADVEHELSIPLTSWVSIDSFQRVTGRDLLRYTDDDFRRLVDEVYGPKFYKSFRTLIKKRKDDKVSLKYSPEEVPTMDTLSVPELGTWMVPQSSPIQLSSGFSCYNSSSPSLHLSEEDGWNQYRTLASPCSPVPSYFMGQQTNLEMLSGGFFSYGDTSNSLQSSHSLEVPELKLEEQIDLNNSFESYVYEGAEGATALLPDFNSLMIQDSYKEQFALENMDLNFRREDFKNLDQYLHDDGDNDSLKMDSFDLSRPRNSPDDSQTSICGMEDFEDKMLKKITTGKRGNRVRHPQSWEFLVRLLMDPVSNPSLIRWEDKERGIFRLVKKEEIARLWGKRSQKHKDEPLTYDNFARILRYHYKSKVLLPVSDKHLVYKLGDKVLCSLKAQGVL